MEIFDRVGPRTNVRKTVVVMCRPFRAAGVRADNAYTRRMTREGRSFKEQHQERVTCPYCRKETTKGSLVTHCQNQHGVAKGGLGPEGDEADGGDEPRTYRMDFSAEAGPRPFPFKECSGRSLTRTETMMHFWNRNFRDTVVILEYGNPPHPRCPLCYILVPWRALNGTHR